MIRKKFIISIIIAVACIAPFVTYAQNVSFPYWGTNPSLLPCYGLDCTVCDLLQLIQRVIFLGMTITLFIIVPIAIAIGGLMMIISAGSDERVKEGRKIITGGVIGAAIVLCAFIIINTALFFITLGSGNRWDWATITCIAPTPVPSGSNFPSGTQGNIVFGGADDAGVRGALQSAGIQVKDNYCSYAGQTNCTSVAGLPASAINGLINIKNTCNCDVFVSGGTEAGHATHGSGSPNVDIRPNSELNNYIYNQIGTSAPIADQYYTGSDGTRYIFEGDHWHVEF